MAELMPCPRCGNIPTCGANGINDNREIITCSCGISFMPHSVTSSCGIVEQWNNRFYIEEEINNSIQRLKDTTVRIGDELYIV